MEETENVKKFGWLKNYPFIIGCVLTIITACLFFCGWVYVDRYYAYFGINHITLSLPFHYYLVAGWLDGIVLLVCIFGIFAYCVIVRNTESKNKKASSEKTSEPHPKVLKLIGTAIMSLICGTILTAILLLPSYLLLKLFDYPQGAILAFGILSYALIALLFTIMIYRENIKRNKENDEIFSPTTKKYVEIISFIVFSFPLAMFVVGGAGKFAAKEDSLKTQSRLPSVTLHLKEQDIIEGKKCDTLSDYKLLFISDKIIYIFKLVNEDKDTALNVISISAQNLKSMEILPKGNDATSYFNLGTVQQNEGKNEDAIQNYTKAIELDPNFVGAYNNRGTAKSDLGDYKGSISDYDKAIEIDPVNADAYSNRGVTKLNLNDHKGAIIDYNKAIQLNAKHALAYNNRGVAKYYYLNDYKGAISDYDKAIEINPRFELAYNNRGNAKVELGNYKGTVKDYDKVIELNPKNPMAYVKRGLAKKYLGDYEGGIADYDKAIELNPNIVEAYGGRGGAKYQTGNYKDAIEDFDKVIKLKPELKNQLMPLIEKAKKQ